MHGFESRGLWFGCGLAVAGDLGASILPIGLRPFGGGCWLWALIGWLASGVVAYRAPQEGSEPAEIRWHRLRRFNCCHILLLFFCPKVALANP